MSSYSLVSSLVDLVKYCNEQSKIYILSTIEERIKNKNKTETYSTYTLPSELIQVAHQWTIRDFTRINRLTEKSYIDSQEFGFSPDVRFFLRLYPRGKCPYPEYDKITDDFYYSTNIFGPATSVSLYLSFKSSKYQRITVNCECIIRSENNSMKTLHGKEFELETDSGDGWDDFADRNLLLTPKFQNLTDDKQIISCQIMYKETSCIEINDLKETITDP